jgi:acetone carboxylase gamma subunit
MSEPLFRDADLVQREIDAEQVRRIYMKYREKRRFVDEIRNSSDRLTKSDAETLHLFLRHGVSDDFLEKLLAEGNIERGCET